MFILNNVFENNDSYRQYFAENCCTHATYLPITIEKIIQQEPYYSSPESTL